MVNVAQKSNAGIVGPVIKDLEGSKVVFAGSSSFTYLMFPILYKLGIVQYMQPEPTCEFWPSALILGIAMLIRMDVLHRVYSYRGSYFNLRLFTYHEEPEFCHLADTLGFKTVVARDAIVYHPEFSWPGKPHTYYYETRNLVHLANWFLPPPLKLLFHLSYPAYSMAGSLKLLCGGHFVHARARLLGLWHGYRRITGKWKDHDCEAYK